ncbi:M56 family metallopeptidase [Chryseobacterium lathyri]|uniref:M56 family metallopeptidase n=1 Tax=Chryseobacterium lathyri TaxID=395933 RepID=UPI00278917ED|nr:M56 family metallopeptidase [Chryseobacterium lathyri]MDQ0066958.1 beta-lactamase regulating signal transducer with metallopeptidase domain [Chryseobacterium lathyri]
MFIIILKILLCSSAFIAVYYLFLEKEKMYRFNRFYLIFSLVFSYVIPFISITVQPTKTENKSRIIFEDTAQIIPIQPSQESFDWTNIIWLIYGTVALFLLIKSTLSIIAIKKIQGKKIIYHKYRIMVTHENLPPFSFWNTIYLGESYIKNDMIDPRVFLHEKNHIDQKHSIDLIFMDIMKIFTWFNPVLLIYKKAIITNHEFLADEAVLNSRYDIKEYQNLILDEIITIQNLPFTHSFNFNNTKKRFIMMTKKKSRFIVLKKAVGITALIAATALFAERTYAVNPIATYHLQKASTRTVKNVQSPQATLITSDYFEKIKEKPSTAMESKKESTKTVADTISPQKTALSSSNEGKNTNTNINSDKNSTEAEYPGGLDVLRKKVGLMLDTSVLEHKKGFMKSTAYIHIDETGKATKITASGDNEIFNNELIKTATAISTETTWKPATRDGKPIATIYKLPATMSFQ